MAQQPVQLDREGSQKVGVDGHGTVGDVHSLRDEAGASRHLPMEGCGRSQEAVRELVRVGAGDAGDAGTDRGVAQADGSSGPDDRRELGGNLGQLDSRLITAFMEGLNRLFSAVKRKVRGYRTVGYTTGKLCFVVWKLTLLCY